MSARKPDGGETRRGLPADNLTDDRFAKNLRTVRAAQKVSQAELARRMAARGWPYYAQTIHRIETGQRKITLGEAVELARLLGTTADALSRARGTARLGLELIEDAEEYRAALAAAAGQQQRIGDARRQLESVLQRARAHPAAAELDRELSIAAAALQEGDAGEPH